MKSNHLAQIAAMTFAAFSGLGSHDAFAATKTITPPSSFGAVKIYMGNPSGTSAMRVFVQRKSDEFCTFVTVGTTSAFSYDQIIVNGSGGNDDILMAYAPGDNSVGSLFCSNLGTINFNNVAVPTNATLTFNGGYGIDRMSGYGGKTIINGGDDGDFISVSFSGSQSVANGGNGDDKLASVGSHANLNGGSGQDCLQVSNHTYTSVDCGTGYDSLAGLASAPNCETTVAYCQF